MNAVSIGAVAGKYFSSILNELGYKRRSSGIFTQEIGQDFSVWIGLPEAVKSGVLATNPVVGLRHKKTHDLLAQLLEEKAHAYLPPTVSIDLGFLLPQAKWTEWYFDDSDERPSYERLVKLITEVGVPFFRERAVLSRLEEMVADDRFVHSDFDMHEGLPIVKFLNGDVVGAKRVMEGFLGSIKDENNMRADDYRNKYAKNLLKMIS